MVSYSKIYSDATTTPNDTAASSFDVAAQIPSGLVEMIGVEYTATTALLAMSTSTITELVSSMRMNFNGDTWLNFNAGVASNLSATSSRIGCFVQDLGGRVDESGAITAPQFIIWIPCGINLGANSRMELNIQFAQSLVAATASTFAVWAKYGDSSSKTIIGNQTSEAVAANSQTMVSVKIPNYAGATVTGVAIQGPTAADNLSNVVVQPLGNFQMDPTMLRGNSGAGHNGYQFFNASTSTTENQYQNGLLGYYFVPLYDLSVVDGSVVLLMTASAAETYTFTPVLKLPTQGSGEKKPVQTAKKATSAASSVLERAED